MSAPESHPPNPVPAEVPASWDAVAADALRRLSAMADRHARDVTEGPSRAAELQAFGTWLWTVVTGDRPGIGRAPRFPVPDGAGDVAASLLHPESIARPASAADVANALGALRDAPSNLDAWLLPDASETTPPRPTAPWPAAPPDGVPEPLFRALEQVRRSGAPQRVHVAGDDPVGALLALATWLESSGAGAVRWVGVGSHAVFEELTGPEPLAERALRRARALGVDLSEGEAQVDAEAAWLRSERDGDDLALRGFWRELRGECWRGVALVVVSGVGDGDMGAVRQLAQRLSDDAGPVLFAVDGPLEGALELRVPASPLPPPAPTSSRRLADVRHLLALSGGVAARDVVDRWAGPAPIRDDPGVRTFGGRVWSVGGRARAWSVEALARPDAPYLQRRVARSLRATAPRRAAAAASLSGDVDLAVALATTVPGPMPAGPGPASDPASPSPRAAAAAALLAALPPRAASLTVRAARAERTGLAHLWAGDPGKAAEWLGESRATEGTGAAGLRRTWRLAVARTCAGDDAGADAAWSEAAELADDPDVPWIHLRRAGTHAWLRRWDEASSTLEQVAASSARLRGEVRLTAARIALGKGDAEAAAAAASEAVSRFVEARSDRGELRALVCRHAAEILAERRPAVGLDQLARRAADEGCADVGAEVEALRGDLALRAGELGAARAAFSQVDSVADDSGDLHLRAIAALGVARVAHAEGSAAEATERAKAAVAGLGAWPRHPTWAPYRLFVATLLADRADHTQTWQWLWSAQEAGLGDVTDPDCAADLERLVATAERGGWGNVLRLAGKLASEQRSRLGDPSGSEALTRRVADAVKR